MENKINIDSKLGKISGETKEYIGHDQVNIHSMPKRFLGPSDTNKQSAKTTGFLILGLGAVILLIIFVAVYYFLINQKTETDETITDYSAARIEETQKIPEENTEIKTVTVKEEEEEESMKTIQTEEEEGEVEATSTEKKKIETIVIDQASTTQATTTDAQTESIYARALDTDSDGLTDVEEGVLGTDPEAEDSDSDGYSDLSELGNLYNPAGTGKIIINPNIKKYSNLSYSYSLYYPSIWSVDTIGDEDSIMFKLGNDQFIQIIIQENINKQGLESWYTEQFNVSELEEGQDFYKKGWYAIRSVDGLNFYLSNPDQSFIYTITYNLGLDETLNFQNIFKMMIDSIEHSG